MMVLSVAKKVIWLDTQAIPEVFQHLFAYLVRLSLKEPVVIFLRQRI
jgi:hypothetical protein